MILQLRLFAMVMLVAWVEGQTKTQQESISSSTEIGHHVTPTNPTLTTTITPFPTATSTSSATLERTASRTLSVSPIPTRTYTNTSSETETITPDDTRTATFSPTEPSRSAGNPHRVTHSKKLTKTRPSPTLPRRSASLTDTTTLPYTPTVSDSEPHFTNSRRSVTTSQETQSRMTESPSATIPFTPTQTIPLTPSDTFTMTRGTFSSSISYNKFIPDFFVVRPSDLIISEKMIYTGKGLGKHTAASATRVAVVLGLSSFAEWNCPKVASSPAMPGFPSLALFHEILITEPDEVANGPGGFAEQASLIFPLEDFTCERRALTWHINRNKLYQINEAENVTFTIPEPPWDYIVASGEPENVYALADDESTVGTVSSKAESSSKAEGATRSGGDRESSGSSSSSSDVVGPDPPPPTIKIGTRPKELDFASFNRFFNRTKIEVIPDRNPSPFGLSREGQELAKGVAAGASILTGFSGSPFLAVQGVRTAKLLDLAASHLCDDRLEYGLTFWESPTEFSDPLWEAEDGQDEQGNVLLSPFLGACLMNPAVLAGCVFLHLLASLFVGTAKDVRLVEGASLSYFPALQAIVIIPLYQPCVLIATGILRRSVLLRSYALALGILVPCVVFLVWILTLTVIQRNFGSICVSEDTVQWNSSGKKSGARGKKSIVPFRAYLVGTMVWRDPTIGDCRKPRPTLSEQLEAALPKISEQERALLDSDEEMELRQKEQQEVDRIKAEEDLSTEPSTEPSSCSDQESEQFKKKKRIQEQKADSMARHLLRAHIGKHFTYRFLLFFDLYRTGRQWFGVVELATSFALGLLAGWYPTTEVGCSRIRLATSSVLGVYLGVLIFLKPFIAPVNFHYSLVLGTMQFSSAFFATLAAYFDLETVVEISGWITVLALYLIMVKSVIDLLLALASLSENNCGVPQEVRDKLEHKKKIRAEVAAEREKLAAAAGKGPRDKIAELELRLAKRQRRRDKRIEKNPLLSEVPRTENPDTFLAVQLESLRREHQQQQQHSPSRLSGGTDAMTVEMGLLGSLEGKRFAGTGLRVGGIGREVDVTTTQQDEHRRKGKGSSRRLRPMDDCPIVPVARPGADAGPLRLPNGNIFIPEGEGKL